MLALKICCEILFGSTSVPIVILAILFIAGLYQIFIKCGLKGWFALIPVYRDYALGRCAGREHEGKIVAFARFLMSAVAVAALLLPENELAGKYAPVLILIIGLMALVYRLRIYVGLIEVFDRKKRWILLWFPLESLVALIWGFSKKYQPLWQVEDMEEEVANFFSGARASVMDQGLTVNLEERTVRAGLFKKKYLLRDIHMYMKPGRMILLLGGSGAGKTVLLNAINGYEKARAEVILNGSNVYHNYKKMQYEVGFVPQQDLMRGHDTIYRTLADSATLRLPVDFDVGERRDRVRSVMEIFGLMPSKNSMIDKISGGQRRRVSIAMELISNPSLFILDEPDSGLDGVMARELMGQLRRIADQGKIVIVVTHTPDRVIDLFDDVIVLAKDSARTGRLAFFGPVDEARKFFQRDTMEEIVACVNPKDVGGEGRSDEFIKRFAEVQHG